MNRIKKYISSSVVVVLLLLLSFSARIAHADGFWDSFKSPAGYLQTMLAWITYLILTGMAYLVGMAGMGLNAAVEYGILYMKVEIEGIDVINIGWALVRDIGNMFFIFVLLYIAVATILNIGSFDTKRTIRNVIIIALLVNFSLFFTKILIDASNVVTISLYNLIVHNNGSIRGFAESFTRPLGLSQFWDGNSFVKNFATGDSSTAYTKIAIVAIGGSFFLFMVAASFIYAIALLTWRFIVLIVLMILSPLAFFFWALPATQEYAKRWGGILRNQLVFAPVYMLLLYIVMLINQSFSLVEGGTKVAPNNSTSLMSALMPTASQILQAQQGSYSSVNTVLRFIIMIVFLNLAALIGQSAAKSSGGIVSGAVNRVKNSNFVPFMKPALSASGKALAAGGAATAAGAAVGTRSFGSRLMSKARGEGFTAKGADEALKSKGDSLQRQALNGSPKEQKNARAKIAQLEERAKPYREQVEKQTAAATADIEKYGAGTEATEEKLTNAKKAGNAARTELLNATTDDERKVANEKIQASERVQKLYESVKQKEIRRARAMKVTDDFKKEENRAGYSKLWMRVRGQNPDIKKAALKKAAEKAQQAIKPASDADEAKIKFEENLGTIQEHISAATPASFESARKLIKEMGPSEVKNLPKDILGKKELIDAYDWKDIQAIEKSNKLNAEDRKKFGEALEQRINLHMEDDNLEGEDLKHANELNNYYIRSKNYWS